MIGKFKMDTVKYRIWNKENDTMIDPYAITPMALKIDINQDGVFIPFKENWIIMPWSRHIDRNKKDIYESDIVLCKKYDYSHRSKHGKDGKDVWKWFEAKEIITFDGWEFGFKQLSGHDWFFIGPESRNFLPQYMNDEYERIEVIGNTWENPDLAKSEIFI
jgi:hypothetical protein